MKIKYDEFFNNLINLAIVDCDSILSDYNLEYKLPVAASDVDILRDIMAVGNAETMLLDDVRYGVLETESDSYIVCNLPFNVTGFTGNIEELHKLTLIRASRAISGYGEMCDAFNAAAKAKKYELEADDVPLSQYDFNKNLIRVFVYGILEYIEKHLAYNLLTPAGFVQFKNSEALGVIVYDVLKVSTNELEPEAIDCVKILDHVASRFDEDKINKKARIKAAELFCSSFIERNCYKLHDRYKLNRYGNDFWLNIFGVLCRDQGLNSVYELFISANEDVDVFNVKPDFTADIGSCIAVRGYIEHITITLPKRVSESIGLFINKYAQCHLEGLLRNKQ